MKIGIISGYFNPLHFGHIEYINSARSMCDKLIVIVNSDYQVKLKGSKPFMTESHRSKIMNSIKGVDDVFISRDTDKSQCDTIKFIRSLWPNEDMSFYNSGDRTKENVDKNEISVCNELGINFIIIPLKKIYSSSELLKNI